MYIVFQVSCSMLLGIDQHIEEGIIEVLAKRGRLDARTILGELEEMGMSCCIQAVYRLLRKLYLDGVITKEKHVYSLRLSWILEVSGLLATMEQTYLCADYIGELLPQYGDRHVWLFPHLCKMLNFRSQILLAMVQHSHSPWALSYRPHLWSILIQKEQELKFLGTFLNRLDRAFTIVGGHTYLDRYIHSVMQDAFPKNTYYLAQTKREWIEHDRALAVDVIGDYVLVTKFDSVISAAIDHVFDHTKPLSDIASIDILPLFGSNARIRLVLYKDRKKAHVYKAKFERLFGPIRVQP